MGRAGELRRVGSRTLPVWDKLTLRLIDPRMLGAMLSILLAWSALALVLLGVGRWVGRLVVSDTAVHPFPRFWFGWLGTSLFLQLWHFVLPVDGRALGVVALAGTLGLVPRAREEARSTVGWIRSHPLCTGLFVAAAVWLSNQALAPPGNPDTHLYFMQTVRWFGTHPVVPGLGNLHHRLAFNQSYHLYVALLDVGPFFHRGHHLANGLLLLSTLGPALAAFLRLARPAPRATDVVWALLLAPLLDQGQSYNLSSPAADMAVFVLGVALVMPVLAELLGDSGDSSGRQVLGTTLLAAGALTVKLSMVTVAAPFWVARVLVWWRRGRPSARDVRRLVLGGIGLAVLCLGPWVARGLVMNGYPAFPSTLGNLHLSWRVPEEVGQQETRFIKAYARRPGIPTEEVLSNADWIASWFAKAWLDNREFLIPVVLALLCLGGCALAGLRGRRVPLTPLVPTLAALVLWWVLAPAVRFAGPLFWLLAAQSYLALSTALDWPASSSWRQGTVLLFTVLALGAYVPLPSLEGHHGFPPPPPQRSQPLRLPSGDVIQRDTGLCWEPPCALNPSPRLRLRRPGDLSAGFTTEEGLRGP